ncbi:hypothetical protein B0H14DRAFT_2578610 [Mycena olivaceomarginata]|nr:hypothetical protein B0H14DRAFT_2578610 [Mycena olivaceomarginata]
MSNDDERRRVHYTPRRQSELPPAKEELAVEESQTATQTFPVPFMRNERGGLTMREAIQAWCHSVLQLFAEPLISSNNTELYESVKYLTNPRYTLQWLMATEHHKRDVPNNKNAAFKKHSKKPKPSPLLLHYNYGVAALKWWGKDTRSFPHYRETCKARQLAGLQGGSGSNEEVDDIDARRESEAERLVLTFYANAPATQSRRAKQQAESTNRMVQRQNGVRVGLEAVLDR